MGGVASPAADADHERRVIVSYLRLRAAQFDLTDGPRDVQERNTARADVLRIEADRIAAGAHWP